MVMIKQSINYKNPTDVSQDLSLQARKNRKWWKRNIDERYFDRRKIISKN